MTRAFEAGESHYGASGHQRAVRLISCRSEARRCQISAKIIMQNFYDLKSYKKSLEQGNLPTFRGMKLSEDDKVRQHATNRYAVSFA